MAIQKETARQAIDDYVRGCGGVYSDWYVGIAADPRERLFTDHNVDEKKGHWVFQRCADSVIARELERYFTNTLGANGGPGGGDHTTTYIYAYKITSSTKE